MRATKAQAKALQSRVLQHTLDGEPEDVTPHVREERERAYQRDVFIKRDSLLHKYPDLKYLFSTLNGEWFPKSMLNRLIDAGLSPGIPDLWLPVPKVLPDGTYIPGLVIDLKSETGRATPEQKAWMQTLSEMGWHTAFCGGQKGHTTPYEQTMQLIFHHLNIPDPIPLTEEDRYNVEYLRAQRRTAKLEKRLTTKRKKTTPES